MICQLVSYGYYNAFNQLLSKIEVFKRIHQSMSHGNLQVPSLLSFTP